jgi:hypothetical protein
MIELRIGRKKTGVSLQPDDRWPGMWRVCQGERVSDMVNLTRAKEASVTWARPKGLGSDEIAYWDHRLSGRRASLVR